MIRKLLIILLIAIVIAFLADYHGIITLPRFKKSKTLETKEQLIHKTEKVLKDATE
jgi:uncharacterized membrane protein required for colicin V production